MISKDEVERFLKDFIFKLEFWGFSIRKDRSNPKNVNTLLALGFDYTHVKRVLKELVCEDYSQGPVPDLLYKISGMWIFGKVINGQEVYIKIQMGQPDTAAICISFHFSEHPMNYPFKKIKI